MKLPERIQAKIEPEPMSGCWLWTASLNDDGYGQVWMAGKMRKAHRVVYTALRGEIPAGLELDHLCRIRSCVNPDHLRPVTTRANIFAPGSLADAKHKAAKTHCLRGHPLSGDNIYTLRLPLRQCRICARDRARRCELRKRLARADTARG